MDLPFFFAAAGGQPPGLQPNQQQQQQQQHESSSHLQPQAQTAASQQMALQHNAQLPGIDMSVLTGISPQQLATIARLIQTGALKLPPDAGAVVGQQNAAQQATSKTTTPNQEPENLTSAAAQVEVVDTDKEDGELEEGELSHTSQDRSFLRPPPTGPRNRSGSPRGPQRGAAPRKSSPQPPLQHQMTKRKYNQVQPAPQQNGHKFEHQPVNKETSAKLFVLEMVKAGKTFEDLAAEISNPRALVRMFKQLGLPMPSQYGTNGVPPTNGIANAKAEPQTVPQKRAASEEPRKTSVTKRPAPAKPVERSEYLARLQSAKNKKADAAPTHPTGAPGKPVDRNEYLARLQAAKNKKPEPAPTPSPAASLDKPVLPAEAPKQAALVTQTPPAAKAQDKTQLARQRLEALKAQQAAKQNGATSAKPPLSRSSPVPELSGRSQVPQQHVSSPSQAGLGAGLAGIPAKVEILATQQPLSVTLSTPEQQRNESAFSPPAGTPTTPFGGLPGLFMAGVASQALPFQSQVLNTASQPFNLTARNLPSAAPQASIQFPTTQTAEAPSTTSAVPQTLPRKRPVAADFDDAPLKSVTPKRPFGQSRGASEDESLIIEVSDDDDDEDDEMEQPSASTINTLQTKSFRNVGPLRDFPPRPNLQRQTSAPGTSGASTPGGVSYEQRMKEIEDMKRKIAEAEAKKRAPGIATPVAQYPVKIEVPAAAVQTPDVSFTTPDRHSTPKATNAPAAMEGVTPAAAVQMEATTQSLSVSSDRPMAAAALARQQDKESLKRGFLELEQDALGRAVPAAADTEPVTAEPEPLPTVSGLPAQEVSMDADQGDDEFEDGELSEGDKFYSAQDEGDARGDDESAVDEMVEDVDAQGFANPAGGRPQVTASSLLRSGLDHPSPGHLAQDMDQSVIQGFNDGTVEEPTQDTPDEAMESFVDDAADDENQGYDDNTMEEPIPGNIEDTDPDRVAAGGAQYTNSAYEFEPEDEEAGVELEPLEEDDIDEDEDESTDGSEDFEDPETGLALAADADEEQEGKSAAMAAISGASATEPLTKNDLTDDDLATELQPAADEVVETTSKEQLEKTSHYTPYESPLKLFKDYRWHPNFLEDVPSGFKSLTYSHQIDPFKPLCVYEAAGGKCNDKDCQNQHFRDMEINDNDLLRLLGTKNIPANTPEEEARWKYGLGAVVQELKASHVRDFGTIMARIAKFRREFVGDESKVVNLP